MRRLWAVALAGGLAGCDVTGEIIDQGASIEQTSEGLTGCHGHASATIPANGEYYLTTFGGGADSQPMACGSDTDDGSWYYAASKQRFGCGARLRVEAGGKCVVVQTDDYGPDTCVESAVGGPILDASPLVANALFGVSEIGWSDRMKVHVTKVTAATPLGPCDAAPPPPPPPPPSTDCHSSTLDAFVPAGTCVQSQADAAWYTCKAGAWKAGKTGCTNSFAYCYSSTLDQNVPARTCVQSVHDSIWYQCDQGWKTPVASGVGPLGVCSTTHPL